MIAIINYGLGNLRSAVKACEYVGLDVLLTSNISDIQRADKVILPGVGAFADAMAGLKEIGMDEAVIQAAREGKPLLGICIGMQVLFETGRENGTHQGLGLIEGEVSRIQAPGLKIPHMGWNQIDMKDDPLFHGITGKPNVYFVHSYCARTPGKNVAAWTEYGERFPAAVRKDNIYGTQFHPEKSGGTGLQMLKNFGALK